MEYVDAESMLPHNYTSTSDCELSPVHSFAKENDSQTFIMEDAKEQDTCVINADVESDESIDENDIGEECHDKRQQPIYSGAKVTLGSCLLLVITFVFKYSMTGQALCDLLRLLTLICPDDSILPDSLHLFWKWFEDVKDPVKFHRYCSSCHMLLTDRDLQIGICPNASCGKCVKDDSEISHFIEIPIAKQIRNLFCKPSFTEDIQHRFNRKKMSENSIEDIYDGSVYKSLSCKGGILNDRHNLSLLWNTDGIPCFKSSNMSLWPLYFQINELPFQKRTQPEYMVLGGLWFGSSKPSIMSYTEPFVSSLQHLQDTGVDINLHDGTSFNSRVILIAGTADLPARSIVCNSVQYNGKYGCCKCLQPGETYKTSQRGHVHVFPFNKDCPEGQLRTHEETVQDSLTALSTNTTSHGIKGPTFLQSLTYYNLVKGVCIDYMHGVLLGVVRLLMTLWFSSQKKDGYGSISNMVDLVDLRLRHIKPPNTISRVPRSIKDHLKHWKASELKSWLLYYSLPILKDLLLDDYYQHYLLFVNAMYILLQDSISPAEVNTAEVMIKQFCCMFAALYGERYMTCNVHQLLHLSNMVRDMGPLWCYSCFSFENANGVLLKLFHGTQHVDSQIAQKVCVMQYLPIMEAKFLRPNTPEFAFFQSLKGMSTRKGKHIAGNIYMLGATIKSKLDAGTMAVLSQYLGYMPASYVTFSRIKIASDIYHSKMYKRSRLRNSYTVAYQCHKTIEYGQIELYLQVTSCCKQHGKVSCKCKCSPLNVALVSHLPKADTELSGNNLFNVEVKGIIPVQRNIASKCIVHLKDILSKCVYVEIYDSTDIAYVCKMPNNNELD